MKISILSSIKSYFLLFLCLTLSSKSYTQSSDPAQVYIDDIRESLRLPGVVAAVSVKGKIVWQGGSGFSNLTSQAVPNSHTIFRIGSVSKIISSAVLMKLVEDGMVHLDSPISHYYKELPVDKKKITLRQLATHTSGIRHYQLNEESEPHLEHYERSSETLTYFINDSLMSNPGSEWLYSSYGFNLLAAVLEMATDKSFPELLRNHLTQTLKMRSTFAWGFHQNKDLASFYDSDYNILSDNLSYKWAGGGLVSSVEDLIKFGNAHLTTSKYFDASTINSIFKPQKAVGKSLDHQGIGWALDSLTNGEPFFYHDGHIGGGQAHISIQPTSNIVCVILSNKGSSFGPREANELVNIIMNRGPNVKVNGVEREMEEIAQLFDSFRKAFETFNQAFSNGDVSILNSLVHEDFNAIKWPNKEYFMNYISNLFTKGAVTLDSSNLDVKFSGRTDGSRIRLQGLTFSSGFTSEETFVLIYKSGMVKIIGID